MHITRNKIITSKQMPSKTILQNNEIKEDDETKKQDAHIKAGRR